MSKRLFIAVGVLIGLPAVLLLGVSLFFDVDRFRPELEGVMGASLGRRVSVGRVRLALLSGGLVLENLSIAEAPAFGTPPFVTARSVRVGVGLRSLLLSRRLRVESLRFEEPQIVLLRDDSGTWNFSEHIALGARANGSPIAAATSIVVQRIAIVDGRAVVGRSAARDNDRVYEGVNLDVTDLSLTSSFPFHITATAPGGGTVSSDGKAGPFDLAAMANTPFQLTLDVKELDVVSTGAFDPASGLAGHVDFAGRLSSDGASIHTKGTVIAKSVQLVSGGSPMTVPVEIDYASDYTRKTARGVLSQADVHVGNALARLSGDFSAGPERAEVRLRVVGQAMPVAELASVMPAIGLALPSGASLRRGVLDADLEIIGPIDHLVISGPVALSNAIIAGFDVGARLGAMASLARVPKSGDTAIERFSATARIAPEGSRIDGVTMVIPAVGILLGSGTIRANGTMDFTMLAKLANTTLVSSNMARIATLGEHERGLPFRIKGTTSNPTFVADVPRTLKNIAKSPETAVKAAGSLFGRKK